MIRFIDEHQDRRSGTLRWGIEPIAKTLGIAPSTYHAHVGKRVDPSRLSARARRDAMPAPAAAELDGVSAGVRQPGMAWRLEGPR